MAGYDAYAVPGATPRPPTERCDCGLVHDPSESLALQACDAFLATGVSRTGLVTLPDQSQYMVPRRYVAAHGLDPLEVPQLALRYGWTRLR